MTTEFVTPPGRIVWGNPARAAKKTDQKTKQPILRDGKQVEQWAFGLAIPKESFLRDVWPLLQQESATVFPNGVPPQFSWKFKDGDSIARDGKKYSDREGYAGHYVLNISTEAFAPPIYKNEGGRYRQLEAHEIKTGDFVVAKLMIKANLPTNATHTPGLYVNPVGIELIGYGAEIVSVNANPDEMFGGRTYQLPPGATATPVAPPGAPAAPYNMPPGYPPALTNTYPPVPVAAAGMPGGPVPVPYTPPAPAGYPPPAHDFVRNAGQPPGYATTAIPGTPPAAPGGYPPGMPGMPPGYAPPAAPGGYPPGMPGMPPGR